MFVCFNRNRCRPNGSNQTILRQRTSIAMMLLRCQASARGVRREGEQTIQCFECFFEILFLFTCMGFLSFSHDRQLDVAGPARTIRCTNLTESWMFILDEVGILYPFGVPSLPSDIQVSHVFSPASRCGRCPFLDEELYGKRVVVIH